MYNIKGIKEKNIFCKKVLTKEKLKI